MALSVTSVTCFDSEADITPDYQSQSVAENFRITISEPSRNFPAIIALAHASQPSLFPDIGDPWPQLPLYGLYAKSFKFSKASARGLLLTCSVNYLPLKSGESDTSNSSSPLTWPKSYWLEWVEYEQAVTQAKNIDAFTGGPTRPAGTLGPVVNSAYQEFEEGLFDTVREAVLCVKQNVATLASVINIQATYGGTCNADTVYGVGPRRYKFLGVEASSELIGNGIKYYECTVRVQLTKTTDRFMNNVGWKAFPPAAAAGVTDIVPCMVPEIQYKEDGTPDIDPATNKALTKKVQVSEPVFLDLAGRQAEKTPLKIGYRYLDEVNYASLIS